MSSHSSPSAPPISPGLRCRLRPLLAFLPLLGVLSGHGATVLYDAPNTPGPARDSSIPRAIICDPAGGPAIQSLGDFNVALEASATPGAKEPIVATTTDNAPERLRLWRVRLAYFQGTSNGLGGLLFGNIDGIEQNGLSLTVNRMLVEDLWKSPFNLLAQGGFMWHNEKGVQGDGWQATIGLNIEWDLWPWNRWLRTRFAVATGFSYVNQIPVAELENRGDKTSQQFLHYLEPSLSLNCGDLVRLIRLHRLFPGWDSHRIDRAWIVGSIPHRSGIWGIYGNDSNGDPISGASNYLSIGLETEF